MDVSVTQIADRPTQLICILLLHKKADNNNGGKLLEYDDVNVRCLSVNPLYHPFVFLSQLQSLHQKEN